MTLKGRKLKGWLKIRYGKASGIDGIIYGMLKCGGEIVINRIFVIHVTCNLVGMEMSSWGWRKMTILSQSIRGKEHKNTIMKVVINTDNYFVEYN